MQKPTCTPTSFCTKPLLRKLAFTHTTFYTSQIWHKGPFTQTSFYTNQLFYQPASTTQTTFCTSQLLQKPRLHQPALHKPTFRHTRFYTNHLLLHQLTSFYKPAFTHILFLHKPAFTQTTFYTNQLLQPSFCTHHFLDKQTFYNNQLYTTPALGLEECCRLLNKPTDPVKTDQNPFHILLNYPRFQAWTLLVLRAQLAMIVDFGNGNMISTESIHQHPLNPNQHFWRGVCVCVYI